MAEKKVDLSKKEVLNEKGELVNFSFFCFDYLFDIKKGKFKNRRVLIKRVKDANTITKKSYEYLITFSAITNSIPIIIADQYNLKNKLKDDVLYYFKKIPMLTEETFANLIEEGKIYFEHKYSPKIIMEEEKIGKEVIDEETLSLIKQEFEKIKKSVDENLLLIKKLVDYYFNPKDVFIKETKRFEFKKEEKIIRFSNKVEKKVLFISHQHKKPLVSDEFLVVPKNVVKENNQYLNKNKLFEIFESLFELK